MLGFIGFNSLFDEIFNLGIEVSVFSISNDLGFIEQVFVNANLSSLPIRYGLTHIKPPLVGSVSQISS